MEFLVEMTTTIPAGTSSEAVDEMRVRESIRARELADEGTLLRLWRPLLQPGEWRTFGLFAAADASELDGRLASMPLRAWRSDVVTDLTAHANDPVAPAALRPTAREYFVDFAQKDASGRPADEVALGWRLEAEAAAERAAEGWLLRLWRRPDDRPALGLWQSEEAVALESVLAGLPMAPWLDIAVTPLDPHPSDPGRALMNGA